MLESELQQKWMEQERRYKNQMVENFQKLIQQDAFKHILQIEVDYDGYGDSGDISSITFFSAGDAPIQVENAQKLENAIEELVYAHLPSGWAINDGSCGRWVRRGRCG